MSMESVFGCLSGVLFLGESLTARFLEGSALILTAILLCEVKLPARAAAAAVLPKNSAKK
jgi:drug/metabolite transporter (DMT)-like permease